MSGLLRSVAGALAWILLALPGLGQEAATRRAPWPERAVELAGALPVQEGGRIKPLSTQAAFTLLRLNGKRSAEGLDGARLGAVEWLLDVLFFPEDAARQRVFLVQDDAVLAALGVHVEGRRKRDRYSYAELEPGLPRLMALAHDYDAIEAKHRTALQEHVVHLAENVLAFLRLNRQESLALAPPWSGGDGLTWLTPVQLASAVDGALDPEHAQVLQLLDTLAEQRDDPAAFEAALAQLGALTRPAAERAGALAKLELEVDYYRWKPLTWSLAAFLGTVGLFIAGGYETLDGRDTMPSLVAVLDTNFWLATHVTSITIGYAAGLLAALLGSAYVLGRALGLRPQAREGYRALARTVYGVVCFALLFSIVGTILGGIWAADSWGRFWGWDPKENGALLIVIAQIAILHARQCGWLKDLGVCMASAFQGTVVAFSWWGVNLLGVGLHSYGFTSGVHTTLWGYYWLQWGVVGLGALVWLRGRSPARPAAAPAAGSPAPSGMARPTQAPPPALPNSATGRPAARGRTGPTPVEDPA